MTDPFDFLPKPDPQLKEQTIREALRVFRQQPYGYAPQKERSFFSIAQLKPFALGALAACLVLGVFHMHGESRLSPAAPLGAKEQLALLQEMKQVFGDKLEAVVQDGGKFEPVLLNEGSAFTDAQPVIITLRKGDKEISIISFSGNVVTLPFDHQNISLSPVVSGDGTVIVEGKDFVWSHGKTTGTAPVSIDAKSLGASL